MIAVIVDDLMFRSKLSATAKAKRTEIQFLSGSIEFNFEEIKFLQPSKVILDLNATKLEPLKLLQKLKSVPDTSAIPVIAFLSHVQTDLYAAAQTAGCDSILSRSKFVQELEILL